MDYVRNVIESELGQPLEVIFSEFRPESLGAASVGQGRLYNIQHIDLDLFIIHTTAHYAKLKPSPEHGINEEMEVCVKLQYPEMEKVFGADIKSIQRFVSFLEPAIGILYFMFLHLNLINFWKFPISRCFEGNGDSVSEGI